MDRRDFLKKAGVGTAALAAFPALAGTASAYRRGATKFWFHCLSKGPTAPDGIVHRILLNGRGDSAGQDVRGSGSFVHFNGATPAPATIIGTGRWRATKGLGVDVIGTWGVYAAGVVEMEIELRPLEGGVISGATLRVVCNLGPAGLFTGRGDEGFYLTLPNGLTFVPFGPQGAAPGIGVTTLIL